MGFLLRLNKGSYGDMWGESKRWREIFMEVEIKRDREIWRVRDSIRDSER